MGRQLKQYTGQMDPLKFKAGRTSFPAIVASLRLNTPLGILHTFNNNIKIIITKFKTASNCYCLPWHILCITIQEKQTFLRLQAHHVRHFR
jgi:hypothetical protein